ncbi:sigma-70 family RNA polymerase sigma factor [Nibrella saemangeumensis]|uniref:Sigma-70 family RNA polymerase sigma factor n=1 Tax=Nibrella saemangeumensis TaxID=1084526 RepID=A0ABP8MWA9_9BACT
MSKRQRLTLPEAKKLWQDFRAGDSCALAKLMQVYYPDLLHWGMRLCPDREMVKDSIQDTFLSLWTKRTSLLEVENVRAYLLKSIKTRLLKELTGKQHQAFSFELPEGYVFSVEFSADLRLIEEEHEVYQIRRLEQALNQLPERQKEIIYLRFYEQLDFEQIADIMHIGRQPVYNLLYKALHNLRTYWVASVFLLGLLGFSKI